MMKIIPLLLLSIISAFAENTIGPFSAAANFSVDLQGQVDTRPGTWGTADYAINEITFTPPKGYRVRILRVYGDHIAWVREKDTKHSAGVLWGLQTTAPDGSTRVSYSADNCFAYLQQVVTTPTRAAFDIDTHVGGLLEEDNILRSKQAVYLNDFSQPIHMEVTLVYVYQFEKP